MKRQKLTPEQEALIKQLIQTLQTQRPERIEELMTGMLAEEEPITAHENPMARAGRGARARRRPCGSG